MDYEGLHTYKHNLQRRFPLLNLWPTLCVLQSGLREHRWRLILSWLLHILYGDVKWIHGHRRSRSQCYEIHASYSRPTRTVAAALPSIRCLLLNLTICWLTTDPVLQWLLLLVLWLLGLYVCIFLVPPGAEDLRLRCVCCSWCCESGRWQTPPISRLFHNTRVALHHCRRDQDSLQCATNEDDAKNGSCSTKQICGSSFIFNSTVIRDVQLIPMGASGKLV